MRFKFLDFGPTVREKLIKLTGFHAVDASEDIGEIINRVNIIAFARRYEREMGCSSHATGIRAYEKAILTHQDKGFNCLLAGVIVYVKVRVIQTACQCKPMVERVINSVHQGIGWIKSILKCHQLKMQGVH